MSDNLGGDARDGESGTLGFILLILLLLGGIGIGGYWVLGQRQAAVQAEMQAREAAQEAAVAAAATQQKAP